MFAGGDGSTLSLDFTAMSGLDSRFNFSRSTNPTPGASFIGSNGLVQYAGTNVPRFDYDPTTLAPRGLLIEGSVTNLTAYSGDWTQSGAGFWSGQTNINTGGTWTGFTAPDNSASAIKLIPNTANARHSIENNSTQMNGATVYTVSMFFKADGYSVAGIVIAGGQTRRNFILSGAGSPGSQFGLTNNANITPYPNGWYRCSVTWTTSGSGSLGPIGVWAAIPQNATTDPVTGWVGDNTNGIQCWGAQTEISSVASSYIPTGASTVQRAADSCVMTGTNFSSWFNASEGTFLARGQRRLTSNTGMLLSANDASNSEAMGLGSSTTGKWLIRDGGSDVADITPGTATANTVYRIAGAYKVNDAQAAFNGTLGTQDTSLALPTVNQLDIGRDRVTVYLDGHVELIKYWPSRLPDATLQAITA